MNKPLILVVEDDPSVRNLITTTLKTNDYRAAASIITTRYGALKVMPDQEEIQKYMKDVLTADVKRKLKSI